MELAGSNYYLPMLAALHMLVVRFMRHDPCRGATWYWSVPRRVPDCFQLQLFVSGLGRSPGGMFQKAFSMFLPRSFSILPLAEVCLHPVSRTRRTRRSSCALSNHLEAANVIRLLGVRGALQK